MEVLPDLLKDLDSYPPKARLTALIEGVLAANIFDWGAKACVDLYHNGTILEIYRRVLHSFPTMIICSKRCDDSKASAALLLHGFCKPIYWGKAY